MSILIKGETMPRRCLDCPCFDRDYAECQVYNCATATRKNGCPLVEVPEPHGRLIDAEALSKRAYDRQTLTTVADMINDINNAPTVIEAEEEE